jgi:hypothetical protein
MATSAISASMARAVMTERSVVVEEVAGRAVRWDMDSLLPRSEQPGDGGRVAL